MTDLFKIGEPCWTWLNPNPHSRKRHRVSIYGGTVASCLNNQFMFQQAMEGKITFTNSRDLSCKICIKRSKQPLLRMQLLHVLPGGTEGFRNEIITNDDTDAQRQAALIAADMLEEQGDSRAHIVRLICGVSNDWECLYSLNTQERIRRDNRGDKQPPERRTVTMPSRDWLVWGGT